MGVKLIKSSLSWRLDAVEESGCFLIQESGDAEEELPLPDVQLEEH